MDTAYDVLTIDLTQANANKEISPLLKPLNWVQFWCDGPMDGITIRLGIGGNPNSIFPLTTLTAIPLVRTDLKLYLTSDVRAGRSQLKVFFVAGPSPLPLTQGGQPISAAEQAVRLGAISRFDRRGEVFFQDDFEGSNQWTPTATGYSTAVVSTARARSGVRSLKLVTGAVAGDNIGVSRLLHYPRTPTLGYELSFASQDLFRDFIWSLTVYNGTNRYYFGLRHRGVGQTLQYATAAGAWTTAFTRTISVAGNFTTCKLVVDITTGRYLRVIIGPDTYDLTPYETAAVVDATYPYLDVGMNLSNNAGSQRINYIDDVIVTKNEPA